MPTHRAALNNLCFKPLPLFQRQAKLAARAADLHILNALEFRSQLDRVQAH